MSSSTKPIPRDGAGQRRRARGETKPRRRHVRPSRRWHWPLQRSGVLDWLINGTRHQRPLLPQLAAIGYTPADIPYPALSHFHRDHVANASLFARSNWIVQKGDPGRDPCPRTTPSRVLDPKVFDGRRCGLVASSICCKRLQYCFPRGRGYGPRNSLDRAPAIRVRHLSVRRLRARSGKNHRPLVGSPPKKRCALCGSHLRSQIHATRNRSCQFHRPRIRSGRTSELRFIDQPWVRGGDEIQGRELTALQDIRNQSSGSALLRAHTPVTLAPKGRSLSPLKARVGSTEPALLPRTSRPPSRRSAGR